MNSEKKNKFEEMIFSVISENGIISIETVKEFAFSLNIGREYINEMNEIIHKYNIIKLFVVKCPKCHQILGNESNYQEGELVICPYSEHQFIYNKNDHTDLFFSMNTVSTHH